MSLLHIYPGLPPHVQRIIVPQLESPHDRAQRIISGVSNALKVDMNVHTRKRYVVWARHIARYLIRQSTSLSLNDIGQLTGQVDHATVLNSCKRATDLIDVDREFKEMYLLCKKVVDNS